jgi:glycosyltransferase involved in cell wall biosynthesis
MRVLVVIATVGRGSIGEAVRSVESSSRRDVEIVVVPDRPVEMPGFAGDHIVMLKASNRAGAAAARNRGTVGRRFDVVAFLDDDDAYEPGYLDTLAREFALGGQVATVAGRRIECPGRSYVQLPPEHVTADDLRWRNEIGGCSCIAIRNDAWMRCNGFDEGLPSMQDWDLLLRLTDCGTIRGLREPLVRFRMHTGPRITGDIDAKVVGLRRLLAKHCRRWSWRVRRYHQRRIAFWEAVAARKAGRKWLGWWCRSLDPMFPWESVKQIGRMAAILSRRETQRIGGSPA